MGVPPPCGTGVSPVLVARQKEKRGLHMAILIGFTSDAASRGGTRGTPMPQGTQFPIRRRRQSRLALGTSRGAPRNRRPSVDIDASVRVPAMRSSDPGRREMAAKRHKRHKKEKAAPGIASIGSPQHHGNIPPFLCVSCAFCGHSLIPRPYFLPGVIWRRILRLPAHLVAHPTTRALLI